MLLTGIHHWRPEDILRQARGKITGYLARKQGAPPNVLRCALTDNGEPIAAARIAEHTDAAVLDLLSYQLLCHAANFTSHDEVC